MIEVKVGTRVYKHRTREQVLTDMNKKLKNLKTKRTRIKSKIKEIEQRIQHKKLKNSIDLLNSNSLMNAVVYQIKDFDSYQMQQVLGFISTMSDNENKEKTI